MEIVKEGRKVPEFFLATCNKIGGWGCGAVLKVFPTDCFRGNPERSSALSFFCEHCGTILCPDDDLLEPIDVSAARIKEVNPNSCLPYWPLKTKENVPPWGAGNMPTREEFCEKHNINVGFR